MFASIASPQNLRLAWRRITTGLNQQYKRYFRHLYYTYEVGLDDNLRALRELLRNRAFEPTAPERLYLPKASGLQRPIGLLRLEDQIVFQAIANFFASNVFVKRQSVQFVTVYSNILTKRDSPFFFRSWKETYSRFRDKVEEHYRNGYVWIADFDLAAFYDTISHELLFRTIFPRKRQDAETQYLLDLLRTWGSPRPPVGLRHGLPQGPIASDFLAEVFLLPVDLALEGRHRYVRYVDDVRLFGRTESEVREAVLALEIATRERGLIPQTAKTAVRRATSAVDAVGMLPSLAVTGGRSGTLPARLAEKHFRAAVAGKPARIKDKTRARFVFFRAQPSPRLLRWALRLLPRHPEHYDAIMTYLSQYGYRKSIANLCLSLLTTSPYDAVRGEAFHVLARFLREGRLGNLIRERVLDMALPVVRQKGAGFSEKWGALHYLCVAERIGLGRYSRFCRYQSELLQASVGRVLPVAAFTSNEAAGVFLRRTAAEPGLGIATRLLEYRVDPTSLADPDNIAPQTLNVFRGLGLMPSPGRPADAVAEILARRYGVDRGARWRALLDAQYPHALSLLAQANAVFETGRSEWLQWQNSFNQTVFLAFQQRLRNLGRPGTVTTVNRHGHLVDFGVTLDANNQFSRHYPDMARAFREMNDRRNRLPASHPYEKKSQLRTEYLRAQERNRFVYLLRGAYRDIVRLM